MPSTGGQRAYSCLLMAKVGRGGTRYCWEGERRGGGEGQVAGSEFTACDDRVICCIQVQP